MATPRYTPPAPDPFGPVPRTPSDSVPDRDRAAFLDFIRRCAGRARIMARSDLYRYSSILSCKAHISQTAHADALMRGWRQAFGREPEIFRPGETTTSFDEAWLWRAVSAADHGDWSNLRFLIGSRVCRDGRSIVKELILGVSAHVPHS